MLKLINLFIIDQIFTKAELDHEMKLGGRSQILYVNCLIHHFRDLDLDESNMVAFALSREECHFERLNEQFMRLQFAGLVSIREDQVFFYDLWKDYIDYNPKVEPDDLEKELYQSGTLQDHIRRMFKIDEVQYKAKVEEFVSTQKAADKKYTGQQDIKSHFINWCKRNVEKPTSSVIKSSSDRLGDT